MIIVIAGETASGKSEIALQLARKFDGVVVNADSKQVYRELKIGTAQPEGIPVDSISMKVNGVLHYLYGYKSIHDNYNLYRYQQDAYALLETLSRPIFLVGGTGLYIDAVTLNYKLDETGTDHDYTREQLQEMSIDQLQKLAGDALNSLNESDRSNPHRLIRLIERGSDPIRAGEPLNHLFLNLQVEDIETRIRKRVDWMFQNGLIEEVSELNELILEDHPALKVIGYQEFKPYFEGEASLDEVKEEIKLHTRQYAKRQRTWFKRRNDAIRINSYDEAVNYTSNFLTEV